MSLSVVLSAALYSVGPADSEAETPSASEPTAAPQQQPQPEPTPRKRSRARLVAAYVGVNHAPEQAWQSGAAAWAGWQSPWGVYLAAGYHAVGPSILQNAVAELDLRRHPIEAVLGYYHALGKLGLESEVAGIFDIVTSTTDGRIAGIRTVDARLVQAGVGIRARIAYAPTKWLAFPIGVGFDVFPGNTVYVTPTPDRTVLLRPRVIRARVELGVAFRL